MNRKSKNIIVLVVLFILVTAGGGIYAWVIQKKDLDKRDAKLEKLRADYASINDLQVKLKSLEERVSVVDSILFGGSFTIPQNLPQSNFYNFIDSYSNEYGLYTYTNTQYVNQKVENGFYYYTYKVLGVGSFDNVNGLIYALEHSKELKKIQSADIQATTSVDSKGVPHYLVKFNMEVRAYFSRSDQYAEVKSSENYLNSENLYNAFFPLVRTQIRPNIHDLPDIQDATLISLVPQGAFITADGKTLLLAKGDPVYMGYLTDIDYKNETVTFTLNKGGIIEYTTLKMGKNNKKEGK